MKFQLICADPPWFFSDKLNMSNIKRGASSHYKTLSLEDLKKLDVKSISKDDAILALWVPSSLLQDGLDVMKAWGFKQKQVAVWVKTKKSPLYSLLKEIRATKRRIKSGLHMVDIKDISSLFSKFDVNKNILQFFMGHLFRSCHELVLIGVRGSLYSKMKDKSQRSVFMAPNAKHSAKPEILQDKLDSIFPDLSKIELFSRRQRPGWVCVGNEAPMSKDEDIFNSIKKLKLVSDLTEKDILAAANANQKEQLSKIWKEIK